MNKEVLQKNLLPLMIINIGGDQALGYGLCKMLAWWFGIIDCVGIIDNLIIGNLVRFTRTNKGLRTFHITHDGFVFLKENIDTVFEELLHSHKDKIRELYLLKEKVL